MPLDRHRGSGGQRECAQQIPICQIPSGEVMAGEMPGGHGLSLGPDLHLESLSQGGLNLLPRGINEQGVRQAALMPQALGGGFVLDENGGPELVTIEVKQ